MGIIPRRGGNVILPVVGFPLHCCYTYYMVFCFFFIFLGNYRVFPKKFSRYPSFVRGHPFPSFPSSTILFILIPRSADCPRCFCRACLYDTIPDSHFIFLGNCQSAVSCAVFGIFFYPYNTPPVICCPAGYPRHVCMITRQYIILFF